MTVTDGTLYSEQIKELIKEYTQRLGRDLSFQALDEELADLQKKYGGSEGELIAAVENGKVYGMAAYHKLSDERCEMKRLYVKPDCRGMKLGEKLVAEIVSRAKAAGYKEMVLDTIKPLKAAIHLYEKAGFKPCEPYYNNPMDDVLYFKLEL